MDSVLLSILLNQGEVSVAEEAATQKIGTLYTLMWKQTSSHFQGLYNHICSYLQHYLIHIAGENDPTKQMEEKDDQTQNQIEALKCK